MTEQKYPEWIDEYAKSFHNGFNGMVPYSWGPVDVMVEVGLLNGAFLDKIHSLVVKVKEKNLSIEEIVKSFPSPSSFRISFWYVVLDYQFSVNKDEEKFREVVDFYLEVLNKMFKKDIWAYESNVIHGDEEISEILKEIDWKDADSVSARELGKLFNSLSSLVYALYRDFFPQEGCDVYGPYDFSEKYGENSILVMKHFSKIYAPDLWDGTKDLKHKEVKIYQVYKDVKFKCELMGMHSLYEGDLINNLVSYAVFVDDKQITDIDKIKEISNYFGETAVEQFNVYEKMSKQELINKVLEWLCYQFYDLFNLIGMDWKPTDEMLAAVKGKEDLIPDKAEGDEFPPFEVYVSNPEFEIYWLKELYNENGK